MTIRDVEHLEEQLSQPSPQLVQSLARLSGDILILGVGGKMGPTLARMARRATDAAGNARRVLGVSRFTDSAQRQRLESWGVQTLQGNLLDRSFLESLPSAENVVYLAGTKFGASAAQAMTWATNALLPGLVGLQFSDSRIVALSTGNVYGLVPVEGPWSQETDAPDPVGEYAMSCLGRERVLEYVSQQLRTRVAIIRLNYATELRYGVLVDLAKQVGAGQPVDVTMGYANVIWQADASDRVLRSLEHVASPPLYLNITGQERVSIRAASQRLGDLLGQTVTLRGEEKATALLSDTGRALALFGPPHVALEEMITWTAEWIRQGGETWDKPTRFEVRDGRF